MASGAIRMQDDDYPKCNAAIRTTAMPADTNPAGDIFGGWLMAQMDLAAGNVASRRARGRAATVAVDSFTFHQPVKVGDEVSVFAASSARGAARCTCMSRPRAAHARLRNATRSLRRPLSSSLWTRKGARVLCRQRQSDAGSCRRCG